LDNITDYSYTGAIQTITITTSGEYEITLAGAQGYGQSAQNYAPGGLGATVSGEIYLAAGTQLDVVTGGEGSSSGNEAGGGGGGSFVFEPNTTGGIGTLLAVAGGGGGGGFAGSAQPGGGGVTSSSGQGGAGASGGAGGIAGAPGYGTPGFFGGGGGGGYTGGASGAYLSRASNGSDAGTTFAGGAGRSNGHGGGFGGGGGEGDEGGGGGGYGGGGGGGQSNGGGGGGSYFADLTNVTATAGVNTGNGDVTITLLCYLAGTAILTPTGEKPIESLAIGDLVITRFGGFRPIKWIGRQSFNNTVTSLSGQHKPVKIHAGALGPNLPARDLCVSPGHSMLIGDTLVLAETLVNGITITQDDAPETVDYYQLDLGTHDCVIAEGTWSESFADGPDGTLHGLRGVFHNVEEFYRLYPDQPPAAELTLCAPRPLSGPALEAVLVPVINRANATPGPLDGCVDVVTAGWYVEGWALDTANPNLPVQLEIYLGDRLLGTTLACNHRADLQKAGKGSGRCAFRFTSSVKLTPDTQAALRVQRESDATPLRLSKTITPLRLAS
jgi:hypothetical protein